MRPIVLRSVSTFITRTTMKRVAVNFLDLERKYVWTYAPNDASAIDFLLSVANKYEVEFTIIEGFGVEETKVLKRYEKYKKTQRPSIVAAMYQMNENAAYSL